MYSISSVSLIYHCKHTICKQSEQLKREIVLFLYLYISSIYFEIKESMIVLQSRFKILFIVRIW